MSEASAGARVLLVSGDGARRAATANALRALRRSRKDLPALACSGKRPESAAGPGFSAFFQKPLDMAALVDHVERMLERQA